MMHWFVLLPLVAAHSGTVTVQIRSAPAPAFVAKLAALTGENLQADREMWRDVLCVSVKDAPLDDLLTRVAKACEGKWETRNGAKILVPDGAARQKSAADRLKEVAAGYAESIRSAWAELDKSAKGQEPDKEESDVRFSFATDPMSAPLQRLLLRYLNAIGPINLASLKPGKRVVYSSQPTPMQLPLPQLDPSEAIRQYNIALHTPDARQFAISERYAVAVEAAIATGRSGNEEYEKLIDELRVPERPEPKRPEPDPSQIARIHVVVANSDDVSGGLSVSLHGYDRNGNLAVVKDMSLYWHPMPQEDESTDEAKTPTKPEPFELSEGALAWQRMYMARVRARTNLSPADLDYCTDLVAHDPIGEGLADFLFAEAKARDKNLVASLPDEAQYPFWANQKPDRRFGRQYIFGPEEGMCKQSEDAGWWTVLPIDQGKARHNRLDRVRLTSILQRSRKMGYTDLDTLADVSSCTESVAFPYFYTVSVDGLRQLSQLYGNGISFELLRVWAALGAGQRAAFRRGEALQLIGLGAKARELVSDYVYSDFISNLTTTSNTTVDSSLPFTRNYAISRYELSTTTGSGLLLDEPTERFPNGLDPNLYMKCKAVDDVVAKSVDTESRYFSGRSFTAEQLAFYELLGDPGYGANTNLALNSVKFVMARQVSMDFTLEPAHNVVYAFYLADPGANGGTPVDYANLPADFRASVASYKARITQTAVARLMALQTAMRRKESGAQEAVPPLK